MLQYVPHEQIRDSVSAILNDAEAEFTLLFPFEYLPDGLVDLMLEKALASGVHFTIVFNQLAFSSNMPANIAESKLGQFPRLKILYTTSMFGSFIANEKRMLVCATHKSTDVFDQHLCWLIERETPEIDPEDIISDSLTIYNDTLAAAKLFYSTMPNPEKGQRRTGYLKR